MQQKLIWGILKNYTNGVNSTREECTNTAKKALKRLG